MKLDVFDPPMCCSSGVCGPKVDPALSRFAADLEWMKRRGAVVARHNLAQEPAAFAEHPVVKAALAEDENCLPLVLVDGQIVCRGRYPKRPEMAGFLTGATAEVPGSCGKLVGCCRGAEGKGTKCCG